MVCAYRGCTTEQIHARFWRPGSSPSACYRRIALLVDADYLRAFRLPSLTGIGSGKRFLTIGPRGRACLLARGSGVVAGTLAQAAFTPLFAEHHLAIGDFRLSLELAAEAASGVQLTDWTPEAALRRHPLRVVPSSERGSRQQTITIVPDGAFTLTYGDRRQRCFLEIDMGTIAPPRLRLKARGYLLHDATRSTPVFFVVPGDGRARQLSETVQDETRGLSRSPSTFFIATRDRVTPDTVLAFPIWEQVGVPGRQAIVRSSVQATGRGAAQ
jgi:hypothetical protein